MPQVPVYDTPQVQATAQPVTRFDAPDLPDVASKQMQQQGTAMLQAGSVAMRIADKIQADRDEAVTKEMDNALADRFRVALYDKDVGYLAKVGKDAVNGKADAIKGLQDVTREVESGLENDMQRQMFKQVAARRMREAFSTVDVHAIKHQAVWNEGETVARIKSSAADAVANSSGWNQPGSLYAVSKATALAEVDSLAKLRGYDTAQTEQLRAETLAGLHTNVLTNMVSLGQTKAAREYLDTAAPELMKGAPDKIDNLRSLVKQAGIKDESITLSMGLKGGLNDQLDSLKTMFEKGEINGEVYDATRTRVEHNWQLRKAQQAEGEKALLGNSYDWVLKNPGKDIMDMPPAMYNALKNTGHLAPLVSFARTAGKPVTDDEVYYGLRQMAGEDPAKFVDIDLLKSRSKLSPNDWQELVKLQTAISKGDGKAMQMEKVAGMAVKSIKADIQAAGIDLSPKEGTPQAKETAKFMASLYSSLDEAQQKKGSALTMQEARSIGMGMLREGWLQGSGIFFDTKIRRYQMTSEQQAKPFVSVRYADIPPAVRSQILADVPNANKEEVERIYQRAIDAGKVK